MKTLIARFTLWLLKKRHAIAASDLRWMEKRAPQCIAEQRATVASLELALRARGAVPAPLESADDIARRLELRLKREGVLQ